MQFDLLTPLELQLDDTDHSIELTGDFNISIEGTSIDLSSPGSIDFISGGIMYTLWRISEESEPYKYGMFKSLSGWIIKRWNSVTLIVEIASGITDMDIAWSNRANLVYV